MIMCNGFGYGRRNLEGAVVYASNNKWAVDCQVKEVGSRKPGATSIDRDCSVVCVY